MPWFKELNERRGKIREKEFLLKEKETKGTNINIVG